MDPSPNALPSIPEKGGREKRRRGREGGREGKEINIMMYMFILLKD